MRLSTLLALGGLAACASTDPVIQSVGPPLAPSQVADPTGEQLHAIREASVTAPHAFAILQTLTEEVGPRIAGSAGGALGVSWAIRTFKESGFTNVHSEPVRVPVWERGSETAAIISPITQRLSVTALGGSVGGALEAEVIEFSDLDALRSAPRAAVAAKIVFLDPKMRRARNGADYGRAAPSRTEGAAAAAKLAAVGLVIRSLSTDDNRLPHTGAMHEANIPAAALAVPDAELLHDLLAAGRPVRISLTLGAHASTDVDSANVVGEVRGRVEPEEVVLMGAHLDSWDLGTGALDDGAGCSIVIEALRLIAELPRPPRRTVRVVLFANEEHGLSGARAYAKAHGSDAALHVVGIEADLGAGRVYAVRALGGSRARSALMSLADRLRPLGIQPSFDEAGGGADVSPLRALGVPVIDLLQDGTHYFDFHHSANDTLDKVNPDALEQAAAAFASTAYALADESPLELGRVPEDKRKLR